MSRKDTPEETSAITRREFIKGATTLVGAMPLAQVLAGCDSDPAFAGGGLEPFGRSPFTSLPEPASQIEITLNVNGEAISMTVEPRLTLNEALRERLGLTGTKLGCDRAACGACTVHLDGKSVYSCTTLAVEASGREIVTIEGLADGETLHPIQDAFVEQDAMQCGFCTPGMIMSCKALLDQNLEPSDTEIRQAVSGNLCRCGTYPRVFLAVNQAAGVMKGG